MTRTRMKDRRYRGRFAVQVLLAISLFGPMAACTPPAGLVQPEQTKGPDLGSPPVVKTTEPSAASPSAVAAKSGEETLPPPAVVLPSQAPVPEVVQAALKSDDAPTTHGLAVGAGMGLGAVPTAHAQDTSTLPVPKAQTPASISVTLPAPTLAPTDRPLPITLSAAMRLTDSRAWDIAIASQRVRSAAAELDRAAVLWVPTVYSGMEYTHHEGPLQNANGSLSDDTRSSLYVGTAPFAIFQINDAIFEPLAARQVRRAREADVQSTTNDTLLAVAQAYFDVEEARANMASMEDVLKRMRELLDKVKKMAPGLVPAVEVARAEAQIGRLEQTERTMRERWRVAGAELVRVLRLDPAALVEPLEPPHLLVTFVPPDANVDDLIDIGWRSRPEMASYQSLVQAALLRWREERIRPFVPILLLRGGGTETPYPLAFGAYAGGQGSTLNNFGLRSDWDLQVLWEFRNLGFGNLALMRQRRAEHDIADQQFYRLRDFVSREIVQAHAQVQSAAERVCQAEWALRQAITSANDNYRGVGEVKRVGGNLNILVIRPQEALAAVQELSQAYFNYFGAAADYNRAQFRLYRAMGNPAHLLDCPPPAQSALCPPK